MSNLLIIIPALLIVWWLIGCFVLASIDRDGRILAWAKECPVAGATIIITIFWPIMLVMYFTLGE